MKVKQHYNRCPEYIYNTNVGPNCINQIVGIDGDESKADDEPENMFETLPWQNDEHTMVSTQICNNSAWNNDQNCQEQSIEDVIRILIDFLSEFLLFLSSILECKQFYSQCQLQRIVDIAERIHQLRSTLLIQINNTNDFLLDISSISSILHELASFIRYLSKEQQGIGTIIEHPHTTMFTQLLDRLERTIRVCTDCVNINCNSQTLPISVPGMFPYLNSSPTIDNSILSNECWFPCNGSNMCIPWSLLEQIKNSSGKDHIFGLMYGIKDKNIRRKLGYGVRKHKSSKRWKQKYKRNDWFNEESNFDRHREWTTRSIDDQIPMISKTSVASTKQRSTIIEQADIREKSERISRNSRLSQQKSTASRPGSTRSLSRQQSPVNSKQSSPLFRSNHNINEPIQLRSIHDRLTVSNSTGRMSPHVMPSPTGELPITSMLDHSESQRLSSRLIPQQQQQQSNIYRETDDRSARSLSFQSYGYRTPSKTTIKVSRESSQSLSPIHSQQSKDSIQSRQTPSINDIREKKSTSSIVRSDDQRSLKGSIYQNPSTNQIHTDDIDSTVTLASHDKSKRNESISNKSWKQRLASPLSIISSQRINSAHLQQNIISPQSTKQLSVNDITNDFHLDHRSEDQMSPTTSFLSETNDILSPLNVIEGPQSAEGEENTINPSIINNTKTISPSQFSPLNTSRQKSTSATSNSDDSPLDRKIQKPSFRSLTNKKGKFYNPATTTIPLQSNQQGYINKFMNCFRRKIVH